MSEASMQQKLTKYDLRLFGLMAACVALAFVLPESGASGVWLFERFVALMTWLIPSINQWAEGSNFPQLTQLYLSILWFVTPVMVWLLLRNVRLPQVNRSSSTPMSRAALQQGMSRRHRHSQPQQATSRPVLILVGIFLVPLIIWLTVLPILYGSTLKPSDYSSHTISAFVSLATRSSKIWLGLLATSACGAVAGGAMFICLLIDNCIFYIRFKFNSLFHKQ